MLDLVSAREVLERRLRTEDDRLRAIIDQALRVSHASAGGWLRCSPGCHECCIGAFAITLLDVHRLQRGLRELQATDRSRAAGVKARSLATAAIMSERFPGDMTTGLMSDDEDAEDQFCERYSDLACPVLDPASGRCDLYQWRPMSCRLCGPPIRIGEECLPPCHNCFVEAPAREVERCRVEPDPGRLEDRLLDEVERMTNMHGATFVAIALAVHQ